MQREWTLTIDLRQQRSELLLEFNLLDMDRHHRWKVGREVIAEIFHGMVQQIATFFDYGLSPHERQERVKRFGWLARRSFRLGEFLKSTEFSPADTLTINTLVTTIPWDLVPYEDNFLGHLVSVGLKIPTLTPRYPISRAGEGRARFLHIVANPADDLLHAVEEARELRTLLDSIRGIDYELVTNPTVGELIHIFSAGRSTPFLHFTGHVLPKQGLVLKDGILSIKDIVDYFPSQRDQFVFINGCDAIYEGEDMMGNEEPDLFQSASVANAFLDAGAEAVISPRSRIADEEARQAALQIWKRIFDGEELGAIIRGFRSRTLQAKPSAISGYSYVLYGGPSSRLRLPSSASTLVINKDSDREEANTIILQHEVLREAWGDAGGPVTPRHIFAALTRRWIVGQIFFALKKQHYFLALERLRREMSAQSPPPLPTWEQVEFTPAGSLVVDRAMVRRTEAVLDDLALLEGLALVNDAEVRCALESLEHGPRSIEGVLHYAREWVKNGRKIPAAIIEPNGFLNPRAFPPNFLAAEPSVATIAPVDRWDLFVALIKTSAQTSRLWSRQDCELPISSRWSAGHSLHCSKHAELLQDVITELIEMIEGDNADCVSEGLLLTCLANKNGFQWPDLPTYAKDWLTSQGFNARRWEETLRKMHREGLTWL